MSDELDGLPGYLTAKQIGPELKHASLEKRTVGQNLASGAPITSDDQDKYGECNPLRVEEFVSHTRLLDLVDGTHPDYVTVNLNYIRQLVSQGHDKIN